MPLTEFRDYWRLTHEELSQLLGWSKDSINHFCIGDRPTPKGLENLLAVLHYMFLSWEMETTLPPHYREMFELIRDRRKQSNEEN